VAIGHQRHLGTLAALSLTYASPPFLAGTKLPSKNTLAHSSLSCSFSTVSKLRQTFS
jgi:hypothetical protein